MQSSQILFESTNSFSPLFLDYINQKEKLKPFYQFTPSKEGIQHALVSRAFTKRPRKQLVESLIQQYKEDRLSSATEKNIHALSNETTYTVTTGHQLNLATGPLYFIYKIITTIKLAEELSTPDTKVVPMYWMASEDHDFEEINHFSLFGQQYEWNTDQKGPVGKFDLKGFDEVLSSLPEEIELLQSSYKKGKTLAQATRTLVNKIFGERGLIILDADDAILKKELLPIVKNELKTQQSFHAIQETSNNLKTAGYSTQVNPREINLFYMSKGVRERIVVENNKISVLNTEIKWTIEEAISFFTLYPEKISPNVVLRPLYQQIILPNVAYIGGPGELAYWLQLKGLFGSYSQSLPVLFPRNFALSIPTHIQKKTKKLELTNEDLFKKTYILKKQLVAKRQGDNKINLNEEQSILLDGFDKLKKKITPLGNGLNKQVEAEQKRIQNWIEKLQKRIEKEEEGAFENEIKALETIKEKLFPSGNLQERTDNFLNFHLNNPLFIDQIYDQLDPFDFRMNILKND